MIIVLLEVRQLCEAEGCIIVQSLHYLIYRFLSPKMFI